MADESSRVVADDRRRVLFVVTHASFFASHWIGLARALRNRGCEVIVAGAADTSVASIGEQGFAFYDVAFKRYGMNAVSEIATIFDVVKLYSKVRPSLVHLFGHKPIVYGAIAARIGGVEAIVGTVPGLGYAYAASGVRARTARMALEILYRLCSFLSATQLIFENSADRDFFVRKRFTRLKRTTIVSGSGVDCQAFRPRPERGGTPVVVLLARMLRDKGVEEFVDAARHLAGRALPATFVLAGAAGDRRRHGITESELRAWNALGIVSWIGHCTDVPELLARAHIVCLPSHVEGSSRALAEAAASGRPIVATDIPGCRAVVQDGVNGFLVPVGDSQALADRIAALLMDRELRQRMGAAGRDFAVRELSIERSVEQTLGVYRRLGLGVAMGAPCVERVP